MSVLRHALERDGYVVMKGAVADDLVEAALRRLNLEILRCGIRAEEIEEWKYATFWPTLRAEPEIVALQERVGSILERSEEEIWGEAQILLRFPDEAEEWPLAPHTDTPPEWADDRSYVAIAGVALSRSHERDGCLAVWPGSHRRPSDAGVQLVELDPGDLVVMHPRLQHSSTLNHGGSIRYAIYLRLLSRPSS